MLLRTSLATVAALQLLIASGGFIQIEGKVGFGPGEQEYGYVKVRENAHMFWWLYYTTSKDVTDVHMKPLIIWLQGGPGTSSTGYGNFEEIGPLDLELNPRESSWVNDYNVLFIDNPVGTGYSYVKNSWSPLSQGYAKNNAQIALDLFKCVKGFLKKLPKFSNVPTYITAESYGGKMAAEFALVWIKKQRAGEIMSKLQGVALGDPWISPIDSVLAWAPFLHQTGMIDTNGFDRINQAARATKQAVDMEKWEKATQMYINTRQEMRKVTQNVDIFNILYRVSANREMSNPTPKCYGTEDRDSILENLMNTKVRKELGVNAMWGAQRYKVEKMLEKDFMTPVVKIVERLLNEADIEVFVYTGHLDLIVPTPSTMVWIEKLKWPKSYEWNDARRLPLIINNVIEGYVKEYDNFKVYCIIRAGHMVPRDNPCATTVMLKHLTAKANFEGATKY